MRIEVQPRPDIPHTYLDPFLFTTYIHANAVIPQVSDGIKWLVHAAYVQNPVMDVTSFAVSKFGPEQLTKLRKKTNAVHRAMRIPFIAVPDGVEVDPESGFRAIHDNDFQFLWTRVKHSLVNNLFQYQQFTQAGVNTSSLDYKNDLDHDLQVPDVGMQNTVREFLRSDNEAMAMYAVALRIIRQCASTKEGRALLKRYREEFKRGRRTSAVWREEGHGADFAELVRKTFDNNNINCDDPRISFFLQVNNLRGYSAFNNEISLVA